MELQIGTIIIGKTNCIIKIIINIDIKTYIFCKKSLLFVTKWIFFPNFAFVLCIFLWLLSIKITSFILRHSYRML